jgi:hypothetical protein
MADNIVDISILCPLKFVKEGYVRPAPYNTPYDEDYIYQDTVPSYYEQVNYWQPWQKNDNIPLQILSNYAPHELELYDCHDVPVAGAIFQMNYIATSIEGIGLKVYEAAIALNTYAEGVYRFRLRSGAPVLETYVSEWFHLKTKHEGTILLEYSHDENDHDAVFETGIVFHKRIFAAFPLEQILPASDRTVFVDQPNNILQLSGKAYYTEKLYFGGTFGLPRWEIKRINKIYDCSKVLHDGKQYVAIGKVEPNTEQLYPLAGWVLEVRPSDPGNKKRFIADGEQGSPSTLVYNIQGKGFGSINQEASTNIIQIESLD